MHRLYQLLSTLSWFQYIILETLGCTFPSQSGLLKILPMNNSPNNIFYTLNYRVAPNTYQGNVICWIQVFGIRIDIREMSKFISLMKQK